jgi:threonyl-tRNA synthetase
MSEDLMADLEITRHSCAHVMAAAIAEIWPEAKFGVGPITANGFYYDVLVPAPIGEDQLPSIERAMKAIQRRALPFQRDVRPIEAALSRAEADGQLFKRELLDLLKTRGSTAVVAATGELLLDRHLRGSVPGTSCRELEGYRLLQIDEHCRRLLAWRRDSSAAAAYIWDLLPE